MSLIERESGGDGVRILALNRPERRNALSGALVDAIGEELAQADADPDIRVVVLTGRGKVFCAGGDLADGMSAGGKGFLAAHEGRGRFAEMMAAIPRLSVVVIAALNGDALGGGCGLASACDLVVADPAARLGTPEIKLGLFPWIILAALQRNVPRKHLFELALTGAKIDAERARELGLVNRISESGRAVEAACELGAEIASKSPTVVEMGKRAFYTIADQDYDDALAYMHTQLSMNLLTEDAMEGVAAFLQRREPVWKGR